MVELNNNGLFSDHTRKNAHGWVVRTIVETQRMLDDAQLERAKATVQAMIDGIHKTMIEHDAKQEGSIQVYDGY